jgi:excisionase family DNA binding protein
MSRATAVEGKDWLDVDETADVMGCGSALVRREIRAGRLRAARVGGRLLRIKRTWIEEYLERQATPVELAYGISR